MAQTVCETKQDPRFLRCDAPCMHEIILNKRAPVLVGNNVDGLKEVGAPLIKRSFPRHEWHQK